MTRRSNKMPKDFAKRVSAGLRLWWARRKREADPLQQLLTALPTFPGMKQVSIYDLPVPKLPSPKPKRRKR